VVCCWAVCVPVVLGTGVYETGGSGAVAGVAFAETA
jgi:hypothetical protein